MPVMRVDDEVLDALKKKAIELDLVFSTPNQVLRNIFGLDKASHQSDDSVSLHTNPQIITPNTTEEGLMFSSADPTVGRIIDAFLPKLQEILVASENSLRFYPTSERWIAHPNNFVGVRVQDARSKDLSVSVYGRPEDFIGVTGQIEMKPDRTNYSRFNLRSTDQVSDAINIIKNALIVKERRRIR